MKSALQLRIIVYSVSAVFICIGIFTAWEFVADDAFITFRYSHHLAKGLGLVWNPGNASVVEGYTNFLWMMIMAVPEALGVSTIAFAKILGTIATIIMITALFEYCYRRTNNILIAIFPSIALLSFPATYFHAVSGMETASFCALLLLIFIAAIEILHFNSDSDRLLYAIPILVLLACLTRPEGVLPGIVAVFSIAWTLKDNRRNKFIISVLLLLFLPGLIYFTWRFFHFGYYFPNSFYVKFGFPDSGLVWFGRIINKIYLPLVIVMIVLSSYTDAKTSKIRRLLYFSFAYCGSILIFYMQCSLTMDYGNRFLFHILPIILLVTAFSLNYIMFRYENTGLSCSKLLIMALIIVPLVSGSSYLVGELAIAGYNYKLCNIFLGRSLKSIDIPTEFRTLALSDAGAIPYYSGWNCIDILGLNDTFISHGGDSTRYVLANLPTLLVLCSDDGRSLPCFRYGMQCELLKPYYTAILSIRMNPKYYYMVLIRNGMPEPVAARIREGLFPVSAVTAAHTREQSFDVFMDRFSERLRGLFSQHRSAA